MPDDITGFLQQHGASPEVAALIASLAQAALDSGRSPFDDPAGFISDADLDAALGGAVTKTADACPKVLSRGWTSFSLLKVFNPLEPRDLRGEWTRGDEGARPDTAHDEAWDKAYMSWSMYDEAEKTRASADKLTSLQHVANPHYAEYKPGAASMKRAKLMLGMLASDEAGRRQVDNISKPGAGRWSGHVLHTDTTDWRNPKYEEVRRQMPSRRMIIPDSRWDDFRQSLSEPVRFSLASFTHQSDETIKQFEWGGKASEGHEVMLRIAGHPRVLNAYGELVTGGQFKVLSQQQHPNGHLEVTLQQEGVYGPDGTLHPVEG